MTMLTRRDFALGMAAVTALALAGCAGGGETAGKAQGADSPATGNTAEVPEPAASSNPAPDQNEPAADSTAADTTEPAKKESPMNPSAAVVYFSCTGNTRAAADLDYNSDCRANVEQQSDPSIRPALGEAPDVADTDTVYLGYPIWWGKVPRVILSYVEGGALAGKTVVPFCTSGSSGIEGSLAELQAADPSATWESGRRFSNSVSEADLAAWID